MSSDATAASNAASHEPSESTASGAHSMVTTSQPIFASNSKRKSHNYQQPRQPFSQARRQRPSADGTRSAYTNHSSSSDDDELVTPTRAATTSKQRCSEADPCNSEDEYDHATVKYDRNNLDEVRAWTTESPARMRGYVRSPSLSLLSGKRVSPEP